MPPQQGGLFCRTCGSPLISPDEQRQQECDRCYDLFAPEPASPASPVSPEPIGDELAMAWLTVEREAGDYPALTEYAGVWLVAIGLESFERAWAAIRSATAGGQLGPSARVVSARAYQLPRAWRGPQLVIEVTTYDARDEADVWRVRGAIRDLGIAAALTFLPDPAQRPVAPARGRPRSRSFFE
jgi:hypothetical protein